jgi:hypothetical protein
MRWRGPWSTRRSGLRRLRRHEREAEAEAEAGAGAGSGEGQSRRSCTTRWRLTQNPAFSSRFPPPASRGGISVA